jgi:putative ABC transport system permease protein
VVHAASRDFGFDVRGTTAVSVALPANAYSATRRHAFLEAVVDRAHQLGISPIALTQTVPLGGGFIGSSARRPEQGPEAFVGTRLNQVSRDYFQVLGIPLAAGQLFADDDAVTDVLINQTLASMLWPSESAVGRTILNGETRSRVVGVVADAHTDALDHIEPSLYMNGGDTNFLMPNDPAVADRLRAVAIALEPKATVTIRPLTENVREQLQASAIGASVAGTMSVLALLLAAVGTFGAFSLLVVERTREIGVRMAIGARSADVLVLLFTRSSRSLVYGLAVGLVASLAASSVLSRYLNGLGPHDPIAYVIVAIVLCLTGCGATWLPARRAIRVDPAITLRHE